MQRFCLFRLHSRDGAEALGCGARFGEWSPAKNLWCADIVVRSGAEFRICARHVATGEYFQIDKRDSEFVVGTNAQQPPAPK